jgi:two-component sensor histidine kinase/Flp pilus assembly protein TadD
VLLSLGSIHHLKSRYDSAIYFYRLALRKLLNADDTLNTVAARSNLSDALTSIGLYDEALSEAIKTLSIIESRPPTIVLGSCYNSIAVIQAKTGNYVDAETYYRKALNIRQEINEPLEVAKSYNNLGELFILTQQYDSAKHNLLIAATMKRELHDKQGLARTLTRLGKVLMLTGDLSGAETQFTESISTQTEIDDAVGMIETLNNLGELYITTGRLKLAEANIKQANALIHNSHTLEYLRQNLELSVRLAREKKDFANGMLLLDELIIIRDSLLNIEKSKSLQAMQIRYETQKKEQEIALLEQREETNQARIANNKILIVALIIGLICFAAIGILIYINFKNARSAKEKFELLLSETHHRIKNNLQMLASIFHLQTRYYTDHAMVLEARNSESRVHTMSLLHERFYSHDVEHIVGTRNYITDLVNKLIDIYGSQGDNLTVHTDIDDVELDIDKALALSLIIQELVCNAFKYAFDHEPNPVLSIELRAEGDHMTTTIHDNGIGLNKNASGTSHGLGLVDALVSQLDGKLQIDASSGTTFTIRFPITSTWKKRAS